VKEDSPEAEQLVKEDSPEAEQFCEDTSYANTVKPGANQTKVN